MSQDRHLAGNAEHREAVCAVGGQIDVNRGVIPAEVLLHILSERSILRELGDALLLDVDPELLIGAEHSVGFNAAKLSRLDLNTAGELCPDKRHADLESFPAVRSAADNVEKLASADVDLGDVEMIGVRVIMALYDLADDNLRNVAADRACSVNLKSRHGQIIAGLLSGQACINQLVEPIL